MYTHTHIDKLNTLLKHSRKKASVVNHSEIMNEIVFFFFYVILLKVKRVKSCC